MATEHFSLPVIMHLLIDRRVIKVRQHGRDFAIVQENPGLNPGDAFTVTVRIGDHQNTYSHTVKEIRGIRSNRWVIYWPSNNPTPDELPPRREYIDDDLFDAELPGNI